MGVRLSNNTGKCFRKILCSIMDRNNDGYLGGVVVLCVVAVIGGGDSGGDSGGCGGGDGCGGCGDGGGGGDGGGRFEDRRFLQQFCTVCGVRW